MSGTQDVVIAAGVESMTRVPMGTPSSLPLRPASAPGRGRSRSRSATGSRVQPVHRRGDDRRKHGFSRESSTSSRSTATARPPRRRKAGAFEREIVPLDGARADGRRACTSATRASASTPRWKGSPRSRPLADGGRSPPAMPARSATAPAALLVVSESALKRARPHAARAHRHLTVTAGDPVIMLRSRSRRPPGARAVRAADRRHRPLRGERGLRAGAARLAAGRSAPTRRGSTSTAARSRSAIHSARAGPS